MLSQSALSIPSVVWSTSRIACVVLSTAWNMLAGSLDVPRVVSDEPFVFVDGMLTSTKGGCDVPRAPRCSERTSIVVVARSACTYMDVHIADALVPETATAQVEMLVRGMIRPVRWRVVLPVGPLARRQTLVASAENMACERGFRLYLRDFAAARGPTSDQTGGVAMYRLVLCGVSGRVTRISPGRALFAKGPFEADILGARACARTPSADVLFDTDFGRSFSLVGCNESHVLRMPVVGKLVIVQFRIPMDFARHELPAKCTAKLLLLDGSVVTLTDTTPSPMPVPLVGVAEARFAVSGVVCLQGDECSQGLVLTRTSGERVLLACAPIVVSYG
jgi:hypothetical protein